MKRFNLVLGQGIPRRTAPKVSGMMEVIAPEDGFIIEKHLPLPRHNGLGRTDEVKEQKNWQNGRLHVFGPKEEVVIEPVQTVSRIGCGKESTRRHHTPSVQILLCTANSLEKQSTLTRSSKNQNPKTTVRQRESVQEAVFPFHRHPEIHNDPQLKGDLHRLNHEDEIIGAKMKLKGEKEETSKNVEKIPSNEVRTGTQSICVDKQSADVDKQSADVDKQSADGKPPDSSDDEECNYEMSGGKPEKRTAPLELMGEFLKAIMEQDYTLAKKLCQMILIYEPQNPEAQQFLPLIEQKLQLERQREADGEGSTDDSEEDTSNTEDSGTDSDTSSEDSDT
ncbi:glutamate-rich protein 2 [Eublepharis macularius]|uniref:Glutamate-rich protein 2 n=1 Tax=Eublepharis macularius TaxID=481883 RepID=A0AA97IZ77_EUBMA|nr:glutamate-rich protein 2 [Eublepharis macularius]